MANAKVSALEAQVLYDPGQQDLKVSALEAQVLYSASRVDFAGFEVLVAVSVAQAPPKPKGSIILNYY